MCDYVVVLVRSIRWRKADRRKRGERLVSARASPIRSHSVVMQAVCSSPVRFGPHLFPPFPRSSSPVRTLLSRLCRFVVLAHKPTSLSLPLPPSFVPNSLCPSSPNLPSRSGRGHSKLRPWATGERQVLEMSCDTVTTTATWPCFKFGKRYACQGWTPALGHSTAGQLWSQRLEALGRREDGKDARASVKYHGGNM